MIESQQQLRRILLSSCLPGIWLTHWFIHQYQLAHVVSQLHISNKWQITVLIDANRESEDI